MPVLNIRNDYSVIVTTRCNWNCPYCAVRNSVDAKADCRPESIVARLNGIPDGSNVTIFGGEPGLLGANVLDGYFSILERKGCRIYVETNGTFFRYPELCTRAYQILFHCSEDLFDKKPVERHDEYDVRYLVVVTDDNLSRLDGFLKRNPNLKFDLIPSSFFHDRTGPILSERGKYEVISRYASRMTNDSIRRMLHDKDFEKVICV
jgi:organic radical activating enzyme